jgi:hypothetical protein
MTPLRDILLILVSAAWFAAGYHRGKRRAFQDELEWHRTMKERYPR